MHTWYMGKRAPIYRVGKAVGLLCAGSTAQLQPGSLILDMSWTWTCNIRYTKCPKNLSYVPRTFVCRTATCVASNIGSFFKRYIFRRLSAILLSEFVSRSCGQILWSDSVVRFCLLKLSKYFYRAVCKIKMGTHVGD